jgi:hypothetical protein
MLGDKFQMLKYHGNVPFLNDKVKDTVYRLKVAVVAFDKCACRTQGRASFTESKSGTELLDYSYTSTRQNSFRP